MKTIIAGSRSIRDYKIVEEAIKESEIEITEIVSGGAKGVDSLAEEYSKNNKINFTLFKAQWDKIDDKSVIKVGAYGPYNVLAGHERNKKMGDYADALIAIWDGKSKGTKNMINYMKKQNKKVFIFMEKKRGDSD